MLGKGRAQFRRRAVAVVGQGLDDQRAAAGAIAFVTDFLVIGGILGAGQRGLDRAIDAVARHVVLARIDNRGAQAGIMLRVGRSQFTGNCNFAPQLIENLGFFGVAGALLVHDVFGMGMAGHLSE